MQARKGPTKHASTLCIVLCFQQKKADNFASKMEH